MQEKKKWILQYDGASKGNPWVAGGGVIIINPEGKIEIRYVWGLGKKTNNQAKALSLLLGLYLVKEKTINVVIILGDSMLVTKHMVKGSQAQNYKPNKILKRLKGIETTLENVKYYHIL